MKNKDLIKELQKYDPEKEVLIQQGEEYDYMISHTVKEMELVNMDLDYDGYETMNVIVIEYY